MIHKRRPAYNTKAQMIADFFGKKSLPRYHRTYQTPGFSSGSWPIMGKNMHGVISRENARFIDDIGKNRPVGTVIRMAGGTAFMKLSLLRLQFSHLDLAPRPKPMAYDRPIFFSNLVWEPPGIEMLWIWIHTHPALWCFVGKIVKMSGNEIIVRRKTIIIQSHDDIRTILVCFPKSIRPDSCIFLENIHSSLPNSFRISSQE